MMMFNSILRGSRFREASWCHWGTGAPEADKMNVNSLCAIFAASIMLMTCMVSVASANSDADATAGEFHAADFRDGIPLAGTADPTPSSAVLIICNENEFEMSKDMFSNTVGNVDVTDSVPKRIQADLVFIDDSWHSSNSVASSGLVRGLLASGKVVASIGSTEIFTESDLDCFAFDGDSDEQDINMMRYDSRTGTYYCYTSSYVPDTEPDFDSAMGTAKAEADADPGDISDRIWESIHRFEQISEPRPTVKSIDTRMDVEKSIKRIIDVKCGRHGTFSVNTEHFKLRESDPDFNYYLSEYHLTSVPSRDDLRGTADITIRSDGFGDGTRLFRFEPNTTNGTTTVSYTITPSELFAGLSYSHSYATPDVVVHNGCDPSRGVFEIWHDVDETKNVGRDTYFVEPAKLVIVDSKNASGTYTGTDTYKVNFCTFLGFGSNIIITPVAFKWYERQDTVQLQ